MQITSLGLPSKELVTRTLAEVDFEHRLTGFEMRERAGAVSVTMYSVQEVVAFLNGPHPRIDFQDLANWVRRSLRDDELADRIADVIDEEDTDLHRSEHMAVLLEIRLGQCKRQMESA
jgi:hypothetical protein